MARNLLLDSRWLVLVTFRKPATKRENRQMMNFNHLKRRVAVLSSGALVSVRMTAIEASKDRAIVLVGYAEVSQDAVVHGLTGFAIAARKRGAWVGKSREIWQWP